MGQVNWRKEYPFESRYFSLGKNRMHYVENSYEGNSFDGSTVLCVHGNPTWSFYYRKLLTGLDHRCRAIAVDNLGCGLSDKPQGYDYCLQSHTDNLIALITALDLKRIILVVHDWGGAIGLGAAVTLPDRISSLCILNTAAFPPPYVPLRIAGCRIPVLGPIAMLYGNVFARAATFMTINRLPRLSDAARTGLLFPYDSPAHRVAINEFVKDIPLNTSHPTYRVLADLEKKLPILADKPTRFVWGAKDWCFRLECLDRLQKSLGSHSARVLDDVGHYVMEEAHQEVLEEVQALISA